MNKLYVYSISTLNDISKSKKYVHKISKKEKLYL